jgi:hypothetical protein
MALASISNSGSNTPKPNVIIVDGIVDHITAAGVRYRLDHGSLWLWLRAN